MIRSLTMVERGSSSCNSRPMNTQFQTARFNHLRVVVVGFSNHPAVCPVVQMRFLYQSVQGLENVSLLAITCKRSEEPLSLSLWVQSCADSFPAPCSRDGLNDEGAVREIFHLHQSMRSRAPHSWCTLTAGMHPARRPLTSSTPDPGVSGTVAGRRMVVEPTYVNPPQVLASSTARATRSEAS